MTLGKSALSDFSLGFLVFLCFLGFFGLLGGPSTKVTLVKGHSSPAPTGREDREAGREAREAGREEGKRGERATKRGERPGSGERGPGSGEIEISKTSLLFGIIWEFPIVFAIFGICVRKQYFCKISLEIYAFCVIFSHLLENRRKIIIC